MAHLLRGLRFPPASKLSLFILTAAIVATSSGAARAQAISGLSIIKNGGNSGDRSENGLFTGAQRTSTVAIQSSNASSFTTRYAFVTGADTGLATDHTETLNTDYTVSFTVTAPGAYRLNIATARNGALTIVSDGGGNATASINGVSGSFTGGSLSSGGLNLPDPGDLSTGSTNNSQFNASGNAVISGVSNGSPVAHTLRFTWSQSCFSNSTGIFNGGDECAVRGGIAISAYDESAGDYPGQGSRNIANDGHFLTVNLESLCGNGAVEGGVGEACDQGAANGTSGSCCTASCQIRSAGQTCRGEADVCDVAETCDGASPVCPGDGFATGTLCRSAAGVCDVDDFCDGSGAACPSDDKGTGLCRPAEGICDVADFCDGVGNDCPADEKSTAECRPSEGVCDVADFCDGVNDDCPVDTKSTAECRAISGICDVAESCDGVNDDCPADAFEPTSVVCRGANGICDVDDFCPGDGVECSADAREGAGTLCRSESGVCDVEEFCNGVDVDCPNDQGKPDTDNDGLCDIADNCPEDADPTFADDDVDGVGNVCDACTNIVPVEIVKPFVSLKKINTPESDDTFKLSGVVTVPVSPLIDPAANGVRFRFEDPDGNEVLDVTIPGGEYNAALRFGWKVRGGGTSWSYSNVGKIVPLISGINAISIKESRVRPGELKFSIRGKKGFYPVFPEEIPLKVSVVIDAPIAQTGQCGEAILDDTRCVFDRTFSKLTCK